MSQISLFFKKTDFYKSTYNMHFPQVHMHQNRFCKFPLPVLLHSSPSATVAMIYDNLVEKCTCSLGHFWLPSQFSFLPKTHDGKLNKQQSQCKKFLFVNMTRLYPTDFIFWTEITVIGTNPFSIQAITRNGHDVVWKEKHSSLEVTL